MTDPKKQDSTLAETTQVTAHDGAYIAKAIGACADAS